MKMDVVMDPCGRLLSRNLCDDDSGGSAVVSFFFLCDLCDKEEQLECRPLSSSAGGRLRSLHTDRHQERREREERRHPGSSQEFTSRTEQILKSDITD